MEFSGSGQEIRKDSGGDVREGGRLDVCEQW